MFNIDITYNSLLQHLYYTQEINSLYLDKKICCRLYQVTTDDFRMINQAIQNQQNCLVNLKFHRVAFMTNLKTIGRIPLISKYLEGSGGIPGNYQVFNILSSKFESNNNKNQNNFYGCLLVNIDFEFQNIPNIILNLLPYLPNIINNYSVAYNFQLDYLKSLIDYTIINVWPDSYILSLIKEFFNILGINLENHPNEIEYENQNNFYNSNGGS